MFPALLENEPVQVLIDSGATRDFVSTKTAKLIAGKLYEKEHPYPLTMADGSPVQHEGGWITKYLREVRLKISDHDEVINLDVVQVKYDVVLGTPWLRRHNPQIDWVKKTLKFPLCSTDRMGNRSFPKVPMAQAIWVRPQGRMLAATDVALPPEYQEFQELFKEKTGRDSLPQHKPWDHEIPIIDGKEPTHYGGLIPLSAKEENFLKDYIEEHIEKGFIQPSTSSIAHGVLFAPKKDGGLRPCIDYRKLNAITMKNRYPLPRIDELQDRLLGTKYFTALDIRNAYYQIRMKEGEEWKTAFRTRWGLYEYLVMPFGLTNAPATFQTFINNTLREYLDDFVVAYLDDVLIFSKTREEHIQHVKKVLTRLKEKNLPLKLSKCEFHKQQVKFLGYLVSTEGLAPDPDKIQAVQAWPRPTTVKEVQGYLGFTNFYRRFIKGYSEIATPLTNLTKKEVPFNWDQQCQDSFRLLKDRLTQAPVITIFDPEKEAILETDASDFAIGACLNQKNEQGKLQPVAYYSRKMSPAELNYDIHDKELLAIVEAFKGWRVYLEGTKYPVQVYTDHKNLVYWTTTKQLNRRQVRWAEELSAYNFRIAHVKGTENGRADALSRRQDYLKDTKPTPQALLKQTDKGLTFRSYQTLATMSQEVEDVIRQYHDDPTAGHPGIQKTLHLVQRYKKWPQMKKDIVEYVKKCNLCAKTKHERHKRYGMIQLGEIPDRAWKTILFDFITTLPKSTEPMTKAEYDSILVITEKLTKYSYFLPYKSTSTAKDLAYSFIRTVISQHGLPEIIISDRDKLFKSNFWQSLMDQLGSKNKMSTAFHPQTDGQTERTNQTIEQYLRCYVNYRQDNWVSLLPIAQFAYNNRKSTTGETPFFANYGFHPRITETPKNQKPIADAAEESVQDILELQKHLQVILEDQNKKTEVRENKSRSEGPDLKKGDMVYINRKNIKTKRPSKKLDYTKIGPYEIKEKLGAVTFKIKLPKEMRIHPVFHKTLLEPASTSAGPGPVEIDEETQEPKYEVEQVLDCQKISKKDHYLVKWKGYDDSENTWEPREHLAPTLIAQYRSKQRSNQ